MNGVRVFRVGDELLLDVLDDDGVELATVSLPIPDAVRELVDALQAEAGLR